MKYTELSYVLELESLDYVVGGQEAGFRATRDDTDLLGKNAIPGTVTPPPRWRPQLSGLQFLESGLAYEP